MKRNSVGRLIGGIFGACAVSVMLAQTTYPVPYYCTEAGLREACGEEWHACYFLFGCWLMGAEQTNAPVEAWYPMKQLRMR